MAAQIRMLMRKAYARRLLILPIAVLFTVRGIAAIPGSVNSIAQLRDITGYAQGDQVAVHGFYAAGDCPAVQYVYDTAPV